MAEEIRMRDTWLSENPEETGPTLFDNEDEEADGGTDDEGQAEPVKLSMTAKGRRKVDF